MADENGQSQQSGEASPVLGIGEFKVEASPDGATFHAVELTPEQVETIAARHESERLKRERYDQLVKQFPLGSCVRIGVGPLKGREFYVSGNDGDNCIVLWSPKVLVWNNGMGNSRFPIHVDYLERVE